MKQLYTGYYIDEEGHILDREGHTNTRIQNNMILHFNGKQTGYSISKGKIISLTGDDTGYMIIGNGIFGPFKVLPWL